MEVYVGIDWAKRSHTVCVIDKEARVLARFEVDSDRRGHAMLVRKLRRFGSPATVPICIETPRNRLTSRLVEAGFRVSAVHPNWINASRSRYSNTGAKSDPADAFIIADFSRTDARRLRELEPDTAPTQALRELVVARDGLIDARNRAVQRLRDHLMMYFAGAADLFGKLHSPIALTFLRQYPTYASVRRLAVKRMEGFLRKNHYPGRQTPEELVGKLRAASEGTTEQALICAGEEIVRASVSTIAALVAAEKRISSKIEELAYEHEAAFIFRDLPAVKAIMLAKLIVLFGDRRDRYDSVDGLAAFVGMAPVTWASGGSRKVGFRIACRKDYRNTMRMLADLSKKKSAWSRSVYQAARARGKKHNEALRILGKAWLRILYRCWKDCRAFDPVYCEHRKAIAA